MVSRLDDDRLLSISAESILVLYVFVGFLEKIHSLLESVLVLDGIVMAFSVAFIFFYFSRKDSFDFSFYPISLFLLSFFILFSSFVGGSSLDRLAVALFSLVELWAIAIALSLLRRKVRRIFLIFSVSFLLFSLIYCLFSALQGFDKGEVRFEGLSDQSNSLGVMAALSVLFLMVNIRSWGDKVISVVINLFMLLIFLPFFLYVLVMSDSRTSLIALVISSVFLLVTDLLFIRKGSSLFWSFIPALLVVTAALVVIFTNERSLEAYSLSRLTSGRTLIWNDTFSVMGLKEYVLGFSGNTDRMLSAFKEAGISGVAYTQGEKHLAHNIYLTLLFEYGIIPFLAFVSILFWALYKSFSFLSSGRRRGRREVFSSLTLIFFLMIHGIAESSILFIGGAEQLVFIVSLSLVYCCGREEQKRRDYEER